MKVSAVWIAKNEADNLARSIESVKKAVDELVVVDTGSTDGTDRLAESLGARVERFEWIGDFAAARNFALTKISGEVAVFLDCDEYLEPALNGKDKQKICGFFTKNKNLDAVQLPLHNLNERGGVSTVGVLDRFLRKAPYLAYKNPIHERYLRKTGADIVRTVSTDWTVKHTGYTESVEASKAARNIQMLERAIAESTDPVDIMTNHVYLLRENRNQKNVDEAAKHLRFILDDPAALEKASRSFAEAHIPFYYLMLEVAYRVRGSFSRLEIERVVVGLFEKLYARYPGAATFRLHYKTLFDLKEDELLAGVDSAMAAARRMGDSLINIHRASESWIYYCAADAANRRGNMEKAMDYAAACFQAEDSDNVAALHILLRCIQGQPAQDVVLFLSSLFDTVNPGKLRLLVQATRMECFREAHFYFLKKLVDSGYATVSDYAYLLILAGKYREAAEAAASAINERNAKDVRLSIFLAVVCSEDAALRFEYQSYISDYAFTLDAFESGAEPASFTQDDLNVFAAAYPYVALAKGVETADRLGMVIGGLQTYRFQVKAAYCIGNELYGQVLAEPIALSKPEDYSAQYFVILSNVVLGNNDAAWEGIRRFVDKGVVDERLLQLLLVLAERSETIHSFEARNLYDSVRKMRDLVVDLEDVVNTGVAVDTFTAQQSHALSVMGIEQYNGIAHEEDAGIFVTKQLLEAAEAAGALYEEKGFLAMAQRCYRLCAVYGHNVKKHRAGLTRVLTAMGNKALAADVAASMK